MSNSSPEVKTVELTVVDARLEKAIAQAGLEEQSAQGLLERFKPLFAHANELCASAQTIVVTDATQVTEIKRARQLRLALRAVRIDAEKTRKALKEDSLRRGKAIDGVYHVLEYAVAPVETKLLEMEEFAERAEAARKATLKLTREQLLQPYGVNASLYPLGDLSEDAFKQLLEGSRLAHEAKIAAAKKAEEERITREKAEAEERERVRLENERLKREAAEREHAEAMRRSTHRQRVGELAKLDVDPSTIGFLGDLTADQFTKMMDDARAARIEREKAEQERRAAEEKSRAEREAAAKAQREAEEKARQEKDAREKAEAEARRLREAEEARKRKEEEARRKAAAAPDREKIRAFAASVRAMKLPEMATLDGQAKAKEIAEKVESFAKWIEQRVTELEAA